MNRPAAQLTQLVEPEMPWYLPAPQLVHILAPVVAEYSPAAQLTHSEVPVLTWCSPAVQLEQTLEPESEYVPTAQLAHVAVVDAPVAGENSPGLHSTQLTDPGIVWKVPTAQLAQISAPAAE